MSYTYSPTRSAPAPPTWPRPYDELPSDHPFLNPYTPKLNRTISSSTLDSDYTVRTPPVSPARQVRSASSYPTSTHSGRSCYSTTSTPPSSWLAAPLTPVRTPNLGHPHISRPKPCPSPQDIGSYTPKPYIPIPTELSILDSRPRQNLLADLEFISGKKLHFPFLHGKRSSGENKKEKKEKRSSAKNEKSGLGRLLKERTRSEEEEALYEAVGVVEIRAGGKGRGVREGNWI